MTKEDYMKLSKERLAELLEERDKMQSIIPNVRPAPIMVQPYHPLCYEPGGVCTNTHMDCINCPRQNGGEFYNTVTTDTMGTPI